MCALDLMSKAHREAAAAGADVGEARRGQLHQAQNRERFLDDELALGARDEDVGCDAKVETPELPVANDVRGRLAACAAKNPFREPRFESFRSRFGPSGQDACAIPAENRAHEQVDIDRR